MRTSKIESGFPVFGKKLKIYMRKGEYGRQYIIPIGRLDLLCEDNEGELYIIELKRTADTTTLMNRQRDTWSGLMEAENSRTRRSME